MLIVGAVLLAVAHERPADLQAIEAAEPADPKSEPPFTLSVRLDSSDGNPRDSRTQKFRSKARATRNVRQGDPKSFTARHFPAADLINGPPNEAPAFADPAELIRLLKRMTGVRRWRPSSEIEWLDRRQILRVRHDADMLADVEKQLAVLRHPGRSRLRVTVRLLHLPPECDASPARGRAEVVSAETAKRLWKTWRKHDSQDRNHTAEYDLTDRDVVYAWTTQDESREANHRGLNAVIRAASDGRGAMVTTYPYVGDEGKIDWPELFVGVGQSAVFDVPQAAAAPGDTDRVFAFVTIDAVGPTTTIAPR
ncbi:MAG: hypothetical protein M3552_14920 [Planctomycetota bacterium]|nr:hypothetical protein [Planctomycetota bacterium]